MSLSADLLAAALAFYALSIALLVVDVLRSPGLSGPARFAWTAAFVVASFFVVVIWFAQGRTGRPGRVGSVLLVAAIALSLAVIVIEAAKVLL